MPRGSPGKTIQQPLSLPDLAERLEEGTHLCLACPFPYYNGCKIPFDADGEASRETAIIEARTSLKDILRAENLVGKCNFRGGVARLIKISQAFCCPKHREDLEAMQDFAYSWIASESIHCFLDSRRWEWDHSQWQCLASDHQEIGGYLNKLDKTDRDMVYRSLTQLVIYTAFSDESDELDDVFLHRAIANLVKKWTCAEHRRNSEIVKAIQTNLGKDIRTATLRSRLLHSAESTPSFEGSSGPSSASISTTYLSPPNCGTSTSNSESLRRQSVPTELPSSRSGPATPERPRPVRSTASDSQANPESTSTNSLIDRTSRLEISPSPAPRVTIEFGNFHIKKKKPRTVFNEVLSMVRQPASTKKNLYQDGWIYVLQIPEYKEYVKIGRTTQRIEIRKRQINKCMHGLVIEEIGCEFDTKVSYHERLEKIIHADLFNERCYFPCPCKKSIPRADSSETEIPTTDGYKNGALRKHGEWFKIDALEAIDFVEQWRSWMRQEPYENPGSDREGELKEDYARRVDYFEKKAEISDDPTTRWNEFMTPLYMTPGANCRKDKRRRSRCVSTEE